jgi:hypothetical protein
VHRADEKRAEDRRAAAMKMNYTKVKPTVVKHVLPNEVMSIYDTKVTVVPRFYFILDAHEAVLHADQRKHQTRTNSLRLTVHG